jgi:tetratricopeptide (TPR) repeat protein
VDPSTILLQARNNLEQGKAEEALLLLDKIRAKVEKGAPQTRFRFELLYGQTYLAFARQLRSNGGSSLSIQANYEDAATHLKAAAELSSQDPRPLRFLAEVHKDQGQYSLGAEAGFQALARLRVKGDLGEKARTSLLTSENLYGQLTQLRRLEGSRVSKTSKSLASKIYETLDPALGFENTRTRAYQLYAWTSQWIGDSAEGFGVLTDALRETPEDLSLQQIFFNFIASNRKVGDGLEFYRKWAKDLEKESASPKALALVYFYMGSAEAALGDALRSEGDISGAQSAFERAEKAFLEAAKLPEFAKNSKIRAALSHVSRADLTLRLGKLEQAQRELATAYRLAPQIAQVDPNGIDHFFDGARKTYRGLLFRIGARFISGGLEKALDYWRFVTKKHPTWGPAWNNLGLSARDLGVRVARAGDQEKAKTLWEESFAAYKKAVQYAGDDPRIVNDCGLMLIYHLKRDYPMARKLLHKAIEIGQTQLDEIPEPESEEDPRLREKRRKIEEAVGDAWQNLGVLEENLGHPKKAIPFYRKAVRFYPYKRRSAARRLPSLEKGKQGSSGFLPFPNFSLGLLFPRSLEDLSLDLDQDSEGNNPNLQKDLLQALELGRKGKYHEAFSLVSPLLRKAGSDPEPWFAAGRTSLLFAKALINGREKGAGTHLVDAMDRLEKAIELCGELKQGGRVLGLSIHVLPAYDLCHAYQLHGNLKKAVTLAERHLQLIETKGLKSSSPLLAAFFLRVATVGAKKAIQDLSLSPKRKTPPPSLEKARSWILKAMNSLKSLSKGKALDLKPLEKVVGLPIDVIGFARAWKNLELWEKRPKAAISALGNVLALAPKPLIPALLTELSQVVSQNGGAQEALRFIQPLESRLKKDATLSWYRGYFFYILGNERRMDPKKGPPLEAYSQAEKALSLCSKEKPSYKGSADYWKAMVQTGIGFYHATARRNKEAKKAWFNALAISDKAATTGKDPLIGRTAKLGILGLGGPFFRRRDYEGGIALFEEAAKARPGDVDFWNNLALFLREAGRNERSPKKAKNLFEKAWEAYKRAHLLEPRNVRLLNDTALIDVYYLGTHSKESEALLRQGIHLGKQAFQTNKKDRILEEALGDSYMNLGVLLMKNPKRWDEAEEALKESWKYFPHRRRATQKHLKDLENLRKQTKDQKKKNSKGSKGDQGKE